ncbi:MAG TPA: 7-cyano-7-deazaguanine synthase [Kiritimatiellia bacterium]|nr:7-cyano-7-deazaguanine synthase [Kiritimatiellia bacterium]HRZ13609.1 7-cyano-7-deazaguanine synthase [Kiritimatiellia bacterium]HSA19295.1 7-cyano-7-deazaguanine synthase [Kiritimatiellia bacterium]
MKKRPGAAILFSGGADSMAVAIHYLRRGRPVALLTCYNGAESMMEHAQHRAGLLQKRFRGLVAWEQRDVKDLFHRLAIQHLESDIKTYGTLVCCGCKLAMLAEAILLCRERGLRELADGFRREQIYYPEQTDEYMTPAGRLARSFEIRYAHPLYEATDADVPRMAAEEGLPPVALQPSCLFAFNRIRPSAKIRQYVNAKLPAVRAFIKKRLATVK